MTNLETIASAVLVTATGGHSAPVTHDTSPLRDPYPLPYLPYSGPEISPEYIEQQRNRGTAKGVTGLANPLRTGR